MVEEPQSITRCETRKNHRMNKINLDLINSRAGTQIRASISSETVDEYANAMTAGDIMPPVVVFHDGNEYILADGFHRVMAATRIGWKEIRAEVKKGTKSDALRFALSANTTHGLKRTNADKRRSAELALAEWPDLSDRELARICGVGNQLVSQTRNELCESHSSQQPRLGADGKKRKAPKKKKPKQENKEPTIINDIIDDSSKDEYEDNEADQCESEALTQLRHWWAIASTDDRKKFLGEI